MFCFLAANVLPTAPSPQIPTMKIHEIISDKLPHPTILKTSSCSSSKIYPNVTLLGGIKSGNFTSLGKTKNMQECIGKSCDLGHGDMAFMLGSYCYSVSCYSDRVCQTIPAQPSKFYPRIAFLKWAPKITEEGRKTQKPLIDLHSNLFHLRNAPRIYVYFRRQPESVRIQTPSQIPNKRF